jgi:hypothetical protein
MARLAVQSRNFPASTTSSPLSEPGSIITPDNVPEITGTRANYSCDEHTREELTGDVVKTSLVAPLTAGEEEASSEDGDLSFGCPHCDKTYASKKSLNVSYITYLLPLVD